ncbi:MAG: dihydropteroate synthase [Sulfuricurvum sp.]
MRVEVLNRDLDLVAKLKALGVDGGGVKILEAKSKLSIIYIAGLKVGAANILKQDALSIGADLAVPRGTVIAKEPLVDAILIASKKHLRLLSRKLLAQPFGLKRLAGELTKIASVQMPAKVEVMGVVNANDDSFYSGSRFKSSDAIIKLEQMIDEGADIIDLGGVSSAPKSKSVSEDEELERVRPVADAIYEQRLYNRVSFSIDSYSPSVISYALERGFSVVNDITGLRDERVCALASQYDAKAVMMHMLGEPQTMQDNPHYESVLSDIYGFFAQRLEMVEKFGIKDVILDVGIGFGKTVEHNLKLIRDLEHFLTLGKSLLVGASRKSLIGKIDGSGAEDRLGGTLALHLEAVRNGASIIRVHDVKEHVQALKVHKSIHSV